MDIQLLIVAIVIVSAVGYAATVFWRKSAAVVRPSSCTDDCGCASKTKRPKTAH